MRSHRSSTRGLPVSDRRRRQVVRQRSAKPPSPVQIRAAPPILKRGGLWPPLVRSPLLSSSGSLTDHHRTSVVRARVVVENAGRGRARSHPGDTSRDQLRRRRLERRCRSPGPVANDTDREAAATRPFETIRSATRSSLPGRGATSQRRIHNRLPNATAGQLECVETTAPRDSLVSQASSQSVEDDQPSSAMTRGVARPQQADSRPISD
jgi:hypothetical protein